MATERTNRSGIEECHAFHLEVVQPILDEEFPYLPYGAALLGRGSEVLGFDDDMSTDHDWRARVLLFLPDSQEHAGYGEAVEQLLTERLPAGFRGHRTGYAIHTVREFFSTQLGFDVDRELRARDWLTFSEQRLGMLTSGAVFHDGVGLRAVRDRLAYYPRDVWLYLLLAGWWRIHPEANLVGRAGAVGDELGSSLIGSNLVSDLMRLCFLMERRYAPYSKWFGTAFSRLDCAGTLSPLLSRVIRAESWREREEALLSAYEAVAAMHNAMGITEPVPTEVQRLWDRPFRVLWGDFPGALRARIQDPGVQRIADHWPVGEIDRLREMTSRPSDRARLLRVFEDRVSSDAAPRSGARVFGQR